MNGMNQFEKIIDYCEDNLAHEICLEALADKAGYSMFHFCRLFQCATGHTPMEYIRKRRLTHAAVELYDSPDYIKEIGYRWGFNSHENFVRAFKKQFGVSPTQYRDCKSSLNMFHRIEKLQTCTFHDLGLTPEFVYKPDFKLAGFICHTTWKDGANGTDVPKHWNNYHGRKLYDRIGIKTDPSSRYDIGLMTGYDFVNDRFSYVLGLEVEDFAEISGDCTKMIVPAARYAVFRTPRADTHTFVRNIHMTWNYIYNVWLPGSGFRHTGTHEFETYCEESHTFSEEIWIPIEERKQ